MSPQSSFMPKPPTKSSTSSELPDNWDPPAGERLYYRDIRTGDLGYMVRRNGRDLIRMDRPAQEILRQFSTLQFTPDNDYRPISKVIIQKIAFVADRELCRALGMHNLAAKPWDSLKQKEQVDWLENGPQHPEVRQKLYQAILKTVERYQ